MDDAASTELDGDRDGSALDSDDAESTASLISTVHAYRTLHGRTYHISAVSDVQSWYVPESNFDPIRLVPTDAFCSLSGRPMMRRTVKPQTLCNVFALPSCYSRSQH